MYILEVSRHIDVFECQKWPQVCPYVDYKKLESVYLMENGLPAADDLNALCKQMMS